MTGPFDLTEGSPIILYLQNPREKIWGVLDDLNAAGVALTGLGLHSFDDWLRSIASPEEPEIRPSSAFYPLVRVEKILLDEGADGVPSLDAQCTARTGMGLRDHLSRVSGADPGKTGKTGETGETGETLKGEAS